MRVSPEGSAPSLADRLSRLIAAHGPISVAQYMAEANAHYYAARDPLGSEVKLSNDGTRNAFTLAG